MSNRYRILKDLLLPDGRRGMYCRVGDTVSAEGLNVTENFLSTNADWFELIKEGQRPPTICSNCGQASNLHLAPKFECPEPAPKKEWEILEFRNKANDSFMLNREDGTYYYRTWVNRCGITVDEFLQYDYCHIYSVKRLLDNEIFEIGDELCKLGMNSDETHTITAIRLINGTVGLFFGNGGAIIIEAAKKCSPQSKPEQPKGFTDFEKLIHWANHSGWRYCQGKERGRCGNETIIKLDALNEMADWIKKGNYIP